MFTVKQQTRISLLAVFALLIGLAVAVPHYDHADVTHAVSKHTPGLSDYDPVGSIDVSPNEGSATECDHGCHLGHHFNGLLGDASNSFAFLTNHPPVSNPDKLSLLVKRRDLRPPISQIS